MSSPPENPTIVLAGTAIRRMSGKCYRPGKNARCLLLTPRAIIAAGDRGRTFMEGHVAVVMAQIAFLRNVADSGESQLRTVDGDVLTTRSNLNLSVWFCTQ
jgi:hypothetical protein